MKLTIIGASGHGRVVAEIAMLIGYEDIEFLDDNKSLTSCGGFPVVGPAEKAKAVKNDVFVAIGNADIRKRLMDGLKEKTIPALIHPSAVVSRSVKVERGAVIMAGAVINPGTVLGEGCIINTSSSVDHDCRVGNFAHISVGAHLSGTVTVGDSTWVGVGAVVSNNINICGDCTIGAGAVVVQNITLPGTYVGVPAHLLRKR